MSKGSLLINSNQFTEVSFFVVFPLEEEYHSLFVTKCLKEKKKVKKAFNSCFLFHLSLTAVDQP